MTDSSIAVRLAERGDVASLLDLLPQITSRAGSLSATTLGVDESERIFDQMCAHGNVHMVVAQETLAVNLVGALTLVIVPNLTYGGRPWSMIENVVVRPEWRSMGIGQKLMNFAEDLAKENHCYKTQLLSGPKDNQVGFYRSVGFEDAQSRGFKKYFVVR
jgi:GNAT superfamily N-acetyltransferase